MPSLSNTIEQFLLNLNLMFALTSGLRWILIRLCAAFLGTVPEVYKSGLISHSILSENVRQSVDWTGRIMGI